MENKVFIGLGSNIGNRLNQIRRAARLLNECGECIVESTSSVYESKPISGGNQDNYYNAVVLIRTFLLPEKLIKLTQFIERFLGRKATEIKWAPREIDIDILFYNQLIYNKDDLIIPHPEILNRDFVLVPLKEITDDLVHPVLNKKISGMDFSGIEKNIICKFDYPII